ncbi:MAG: NAD-dependent epimerase/dehydratase family protein [Acidobacteriota bacterium]
MKVLLLGGGGFISSAVEARLDRAGLEVTVFNRSGHTAVPRSASVRGEREDARSLARAARSIDAVVDFRCYSAASAEKAVTAFSGLPGPYVLISTGSVYWCTGDWTNPVAEDQYERSSLVQQVPTPLLPGSVEFDYGCGKREAEAVFAAAAAAGRMRSVRLRFPVVAGPGDPSGRYAGYIARILAGDPIAVPDGGFNSFRHLYVDDAAEAVAAALSARDASGGYNVASREIFSVRDLLHRLAAALGQDEPEVVDIPILFIERRGASPLFAPFSCRRDQILDPTRAENGLGLAPTPAGEWLGRTAEWARDAGGGVDGAVRRAEADLIASFRRAMGAG